MSTNEDPIFDFAPLKRFLERRGYKIGTRLAYEAVKPEDIKPEDVANGSMEFRNDGIFIIGKDGSERQVFLYKKDYRLQQYGKPRFHICKCPTIEEFISSGRFKQHYVRANTEPVPVIDLDDGRILKDISGLPLCRYCMEMIDGYGKMTTTQFVELLKAANGNNTNNDDIERDMFGYTRDWDMISKDYREEHHYTCEKCGLMIEDDYDKQFVHVHHINGDKLNNDKSNLKCLCLYCHAHVDQHHLKRLTTGANRYVYESFIMRYGDEANWPTDKPNLHITVHNHYHGTVENVVNVEQPKE